MRVFILEDEPLIAWFVSQIIEDMGANIVGPSHDLRSGLDMARAEEIDFAILDLTVQNTSCNPVAEALLQRRIPYALLTGYDRVPPELSGADIIRTPCIPAEIKKIVLKHLPPGGIARLAGRSHHV